RHTREEGHHEHRQFCASAVAAALVLLAGTGTASAQGTVSWTPPFPVGNPPPRPGAPGSVDVLGSYTIAAGWTAVGGNFTWTPASGGTPAGVALNILNNAQGTGGSIGALLNGQIVAARITMAPGRYQGWLTVSYVPVNSPPGTVPTLIIST